MVNNVNRQCCIFYCYSFLIPPFIRLIHENGPIYKSGGRRRHQSQGKWKIAILVAVVNEGLEQSEMTERKVKISSRDIFPKIRWLGCFLSISPTMAVPTDTSLLVFILLLHPSSLYFLQLSIDYSQKDKIRNVCIKRAHESR